MAEAGKNLGNNVLYACSKHNTRAFHFYSPTQAKRSTTKAVFLSENRNCLVLDNSSHTLRFQFELSITSRRLPIVLGTFTYSRWNILRQSYCQLLFKQMLEGESHWWPRSSTWRRRSIKTMNFSRVVSLLLRLFAPLKSEFTAFHKKGGKTKTS